MNFKFNIGETVIVENVVGVVLERELSEGENDYLIQPVNRDQMILGQTELGSGWVLERNIETNEV